MKPFPMSETRSTVRSASRRRRTWVATASCAAGSCWRSVWASSRPASISPEWVAPVLALCCVLHREVSLHPGFPLILFILLSPRSTCWTSSALLRPATPPTAPSGCGGRWWTGCEENLPPGWSWRYWGVLIEMSQRDSGVIGVVCKIYKEAGLTANFVFRPLFGRLA